jgi:hypothetical protein
MSPPEGDLPQILHLAEQLVQVVGQQRFKLLPELLESGKVYRGMTKQKLAQLVEGLQPQVDQLAEVLSLELAEKRDYAQMLLAAHQAMSKLSEDVAGSIHTERDLDARHEMLLAETHELSQAMRDFLKGPAVRNSANAADGKLVVGHAAHVSVGSSPRTKKADAVQLKSYSTVVQALVSAASRCRERRSELSLLLIEPNVVDDHSDQSAKFATRHLRLAVLHECSSLDPGDVNVTAVSAKRTAVILSNCERRTAVAFAQNVIAALGKHGESTNAHHDDGSSNVSIGVATAGVIPRNFDPMQLIGRAEGCLSAARACGISTVKSIEA